MTVIFLKHQWKSFWRSRNKAGSIVAQMVLGLFMLYFIVVSIGIGFWMSELIHKVFPDQNAITVFNGFILYYFLIDFASRTQLQELPTLSIVPYLHLKIKKSTIVNFLNLKSVFTVFNVIPLLLFIPFTILQIGGTFGALTALAYILSTVALSLFNNFLVLYLKRRSINNVLYFGVAVAAIAVFGGLDYLNIISIRNFSNWVFGGLTIYPVLSLVFVGLALLIFGINSKFLKANLYLEELSSKQEQKAATDYSFLNRFGKVGELAALELKLILRHKRSKSSFFMGFILLFYGFLFYKEKYLADNSFGFMLFAAIFMTGISLINYGQFMFAWQSAHFDGLLAKKIDLKNFIKAKFLLFTLSSTVITILSSFYGLISSKLLLLHLAAYLYNIGFGTVVVLWFATLNRKRMDLGKSAAFNWQGVGATQWILGFPLLLLPFLFYIPFGIFKMPYVGLLAVAAFGIVNLLLRNFWVDVITKKLIKQRYKIAEGFRA